MKNYYEKIEQEYIMFHKDGVTPLGWPINGYPAPQGPYYCGVGKGNCATREFMEQAVQHMVDSGLNINNIWGSHEFTLFDESSEIQIYECAIARSCASVSSRSRMVE